MIKVTLSANGFTVSGHSGYDEAGSDIVCASVSACTNMVLAGLEDVLQINCKIDINPEIPLVKVEIPSGISAKQADGASLMLEAFKFQIKSIEEEYGDYLKLF